MPTPSLQISVLVALAAGARSARLKTWDGIDKPGVQVAVHCAVKPGDEACLKGVDEFIAAIKRNGLAEIVVSK